MEIADLILRLRHPADAWTTGLIDADRALDFLEKCHASPWLLPRSSVVCIVTLGEPVKADTIIPPECGDSDRIDHQMWAWPLTAIERLSPPEPARGAQGFWTWVNPNA